MVNHIEPRRRKRYRIGAFGLCSSDDTHHEIEKLLTDHQRQLAKAMQERMHSEDGTHP